MIERAPKIEIELSLDEAYLYVLTLDYDNNKDWRLPSFQEYMSDLFFEGHVWYANFIAEQQTVKLVRCVIPVRDKDD